LKIITISLTFRRSGLQSRRNASLWGFNPWSSRG
jgi:hypothetical protein